MKKIREPSLATRILALTVGIAFFYSSCSFGPGDPPKPGDQGSPNSPGIQQLAEHIDAAISPEVFSALTTIIEENPEIDLDPGTLEKLNLLLTDPKSALEHIAKEENGAAILAFAEVVFNEGTVEEAIAVLEALDPDAAVAFVGFLDEIAEALEMENKPVNIVQNRSETSRPNIRNMPITLVMRADDQLARNFLFFDGSLEWPNVGFYAGFCVATALGAYGATSLIPWVQVVGIVALVAGTFSMASQLIAWRDHKDLFSFGGKLAAVIFRPGDVIAMAAAIEELIHVLQLPECNQILLISGLTCATAVACSLSPLGRVAIRSVVSFYEEILAFVKSKVPSWVEWRIDGITITPPDAPAQEIQAPPLDIYMPTKQPSKPKPVWWNPFTWF